MADFSTVLAQLDLDRPRENITSIKRAVTEQIQSTDKRVSCRWTDYFNHGFAPDLVLMWPEDKAERFVFLRTSYDAVGLHLDVETLADSKPMIVSLEPDFGQD